MDLIFEQEMIPRLRQILSRVRTTTNDHASQRWRRILVALVGAFVSRVVAYIGNLAAVPIALHYLGAESYGVWITLTSAVTLLAFMDLGIGIGLQNRTAEMLGQERLEDLALCVRSTLVVLSILALILFGAFLVLITKTGLPGRIFSGNGFALIDIKSVLLIIAGAFAVGLPLGSVSRIAFGMQLGWISSVAATAGTILTLIAVIAGSVFHLNFTQFIALTVFSPVVGQVFAFIILQRYVPGGLRIFGPIDFRDGILTVKKGGHYILPQLSGAIVMQAPTIALGTCSSATSAAVYGILMRIGAPVQQLQRLFLVQVWPAITEAMHRGDRVWLQKALRRIFRVNMTFSACAFILIYVMICLVYPMLSRSNVMSVSVSAGVLFSAGISVMCVNDGLSYIANGLARMRMQNIISVVYVLFVLTALRWISAKKGLEGTLIAMLSMNCLFVLPLMYRDYKKYLSDL